MSVPVLGILGGMGPDATVEFMGRIVKATPARDDADHLRMIVDNNPRIPSRIKALIEGTGEDPGPALEAMAQGLARAGATVLAMPCNTAHHYLPRIAGAVDVPVLDMVGLSVGRLRALVPAGTVGLLASPALRRIGLFDTRLAAAGLAVLHPDETEEAAILALIRAVKRGQVPPEALEAYREIAGRLVARGADALAIACTELSVVGGLDGAGVPVVDTLDVLVEAVLAQCLPGAGSAEGTACHFGAAEG